MSERRSSAVRSQQRKGGDSSFARRASDRSLPLARNDRGATPVVGKALEVGIVVLYIALLTTVLYGGLVPEYRAAAGSDVGDRVLAEATQEIQGAVPESERARARTTIDVPDRIHDSDYQLRAVERPEGYRLALEHPHPEIGSEVPVFLPADVVAFEGAWTSTERGVVVVERTPEGRTIELRQPGERP